MSTALLQTLSTLLREAFPESDNAARREQLLGALVSVLGEARQPRALEVSLLGRCAVRAGGKTIEERDWPTQKSLLLFAFLAARGGRPVPDAVLSGTFWPESSEERAKSSLRNALYQVRATLAGAGDVTLDVQRNRCTRTVTLRTPLATDVEAFETGVSEAAKLFAEGPVAAQERLRSALSLYRGEFLEGFEDDWILARRAQLADLHLQALHLAARCHLALGEAGAAEQVSRDAITRDDLREDLHADLIEALAEQGRRGEALRHYREVVAHFEAEVGTVPSTLHDIYDVLLAEGGCQAPSIAQSGALLSRKRPAPWRLARPPVAAAS